QSAASDGSTFQAMLKNQITQNAGDFVKAANIVLRDGNQGQIDMILHPEELGNVRISMEVRGKEIIGHVTVASREAMEAFEQSSQALKNSFLQSGFESASFDVSFAGSQMQFAQQNASGQNDESRAMQGRKIYGEFAQESLTSLDDVSDTFIDDDVSVNIVA
ncbi:MAG: flagellar hook-length control protein FliK, partial [Treponema sp.]|nr:flagellar hook-length control protein FliK [Treponema sp.]